MGWGRAGVPAMAVREVDGETGTARAIRWCIPIEVVLAEPTKSFPRTPECWRTQMEGER